MAMVRAEPLMNPAMEGPEMKSIINPILNNPTANVTNPAMSAREDEMMIGDNEGYSSFISASISPNNNDITATGPIINR